MDLAERDLRGSHAPGHGTRTHPWETARARLVVALLRGTPAGRVLDVGAGDAFVARALTNADASARVTAVDSGYTDADVAQYRTERIEPVRAMPSGPYDTALLLDVLEHVDDDRALLADVVARVAPGGRVLVTVPAWPLMFSQHDRALAHRRRYRPDEVESLVHDVGLMVARSGGAFLSLLPVRALAVVGERAGLSRVDGPPNGVGAWRGGATLTAALARALDVDSLAARALSRVGVRAPGLSHFVLARTPK
jgi:SAM-dependent methyltransferase